MRSSGTFAVLLSIVVMAHPTSSAQTSTAPPQRNAPGEGQLPSDRDRDPSFEFPPLPKVTVSLLGGTVAKVDPIRDRAVVRAFGGRDFTIDFDGRTKVMRAEMAVSTREIRPGARIYADTIVVNCRILAKTIRIEPSPAVGEVRGQVTNYDPTTGVLSVRDALSPEPLRVHITPETAIRGGDPPAQASQLAVGTLVKIGFRAGAEGAGQAQKVDILAQPGSTFTFAGKITFVDVRTGYVAIADRAEGNSYEVAVDRLTPEVKLRLKEGTDVIIHAQFDGRSTGHRRSSQHQVGVTDVSAGLFRDYKIIGCSAHPPYRAGSFGRGSLDRAICSG